MSFDAEAEEFQTEPANRQLDYTRLSSIFGFLSFMTFSNFFVYTVTLAKTFAKDSDGHPVNQSKIGLKQRG